MPPPDDGDRSRVVRFERDGRVGSIARSELVRLAAGVQLAAMIMQLVTTVHRTDKGLVVDLDKNPQWRQIYADPSPDLRIMASAQVGKSLYCTLRIFAAAELGFETGFVMPTDPKRNEFVHNRIHRTIEHTEYYRERIADAAGVDSVREKHYRDSSGHICPIHFAAAATDNELIAFSADQMMIDERDRCNRANLKLYPSRMNQSDYRLTVEVSTPTLPGYEKTGKPADVGPDNIHTEFLCGTQNRWHITCPHCQHEQAPTWEDNFVKVELDESGRIIAFKVRDPGYTMEGPVDLRACCAKCERPFDRLSAGRWISARPDRRIVSYWVNRLCADVGEPISALLNRFREALNNPSAMQQFYNMDLGMPFAGGYTAFREDMFRRCAGDHRLADGWWDSPTTAGIDVNVPFFDVHISRWQFDNLACPQVKLFAGKIQGTQALFQILKRFNVKVACIDQQPELNLACTLQEQAPAQCDGLHLIRCKYGTQAMMDPIVVSEKSDQADEIPLLLTLDRTATLDAEFASTLNGRVKYFSNYLEAADARMVPEFCRPVRTIVVNDQGEERWTWVGKPDHQLHAASLDRIAGQIGRNRLGGGSGAMGFLVDYTSARTHPVQNTAEPPEVVMAAMLAQRGFR